MGIGPGDFEGLVQRALRRHFVALGIPQRDALRFPLSRCDHTLYPPSFLDACIHMPDEDQRIVNALFGEMIVKYQTKQMVGNLTN